MVSDQPHLDPPDAAATPAPPKKGEWPAARKGHRPLITTDEGRQPRIDPDTGRMDLIEQHDLRDAIEHRANRVRVTALERRVLPAVLRRTVRRGRLADKVSHAFLARFSDCHPKEVGPALRALAGCGMIRYTPGDTVRTDDHGYSRTYSRIAVLIPPRWKTFRGGDAPPRLGRPADWIPEPVVGGRKDLPGWGTERPSPVGDGKTFPHREGKTLPGGGRKDPADSDTDRPDTDSAETDGVVTPTPSADSLRSRPDAATGHRGEYDEPLGPDGWTWDRVASVPDVVSCLHANVPLIGQELLSTDRRAEVVQGLWTLDFGPLQLREALYLAAVWAGQTNYTYANHIVQRVTRFRDQYEVADMVEALADASPAEVVATGLEHGTETRNDLDAARVARRQTSA